MSDGYTPSLFAVLPDPVEDMGWQLPQFDQSGRRDEQAQAMGMDPPPERQAALRGSQLDPSSPSAALLRSYTGGATTALQRGLGGSRQIDPGSDTSDFTRYLHVEPEENLALRIGRAFWESHKFWERDITAQERVWRALNVASYAVPFGVGAKTGAAAIRYVFPKAGGALVMSRKGRVMLAALSEATIAGGIEAVRPDAGTGSVVISAALGGTIGAGVGAFMTRAGTKAANELSTAIGERLQSADNVEEALRTDKWAILEMGSKQEGELAANQAENYEAIMQEWRQMGQPNPKPEPPMGQAQIIAARTATIMDNLTSAGYRPIAARGPSGVDAILVPGMPNAEAQAVAKTLGLNQFMTNEGLVDMGRGIMRPVVQHKLGSAVSPADGDAIYSFARKTQGTPDAPAVNGMQHFTARLSDEPVMLGSGRSVPPSRNEEIFDATWKSGRDGSWFSGVRSGDLFRYIYRKTLNGWEGAYAFDKVANPGRATRARPDRPGQGIVARVFGRPEMRQSVSDVLNGRSMLSSEGIQKMGQLMQAKWSGVLEQSVMRHIPSFWHSGRRAMPRNVARHTNRGLRSIIEDVPANELDDLEWLGAARMQQAFARQNLPVDERFLRNAKEGEDAAAVIERDILGMFSPEKLKFMDEKLREITRWRNLLKREMLGESGIMRHKALDAMELAYDINVPSWKVRRKPPRTAEALNDEILAPQAPIKRVGKDSEEKYVPWLEQIVSESAAIIRVAEQQRIYNQMANIVNEAAPSYHGIIEWAPRGPPKAPPRYADTPDAAGMFNGSRVDGPDGTYIRGFVNNDAGRPFWMRVANTSEGDALLDAMQMLGPQHHGAFVELGRYFAQAVRTGVVLDPSFGSKAVFRDLPYAFASAGLHPASFIEGSMILLSSSKLGRLASKDLPSSIGKRMQRMQQIHDTWVTAGGMKGALSSIDRPSLRRLIRQMVPSRSAGEAVKRLVVRNPLDGLSAIAELLENSTRVGAFNSRYRNLMQGAARSGKMIDPQDLINEAALFSREVSVDFQVRGTASWVGALRMTSAFWGATLQGTDQLRLAIQRDPVGVAMRSSMAITLPSIMTYLMNRGNEDYKKLNRAERDLFWMIPMPEVMREEGDDDAWLRIPKPFELGYMAGSMVERFLEFMDEQDPELLDEVSAEMFYDMISAYAPIPTVAEPLFEAHMNRNNFTGAPIVGPDEENLATRFHDASSFARGMARFVNGDLDDLDPEAISPLVFDNMIRGWTGSLGIATSQIGDVAMDAARRARGEPLSQAPHNEWYRVAPFMRGFVSPFPTNAQPVQDLYDYAERARNAANTLEVLQERMAADDYQEWYTSHPKWVVVDDILQSPLNKIQEWRDLRAEVENAPTLSPREKRQYERQLNRAILDMSHEYVEAMEELGLRPDNPKFPVFTGARRFLGSKN